MEYKDYYATLGVSRDAKEDEIKRVYRKLARKYHPDVSKEPNAEEKFKEVQEAYEVLKDQEKRSAYDQLGSNWKSGQDFRPPPGWDGGAGFQGGGGFHAEDLGGFSDFFSSIFGQGQRADGFHARQRSHARRGRDEHAKITITLEEAYQGGEKSIQLRVPEMNAQGQMHYQLKTLKITIPAGVTSGQQLRLGKQGAPGIQGGPAGDLYLEIEIASHRLYTLEGRDIYLTLPITPWEAALGAKIAVPTLGGAVEMKVAPDAQTGQKMRLKGRGLPHKTQPGDQYILLQITTPPAKTEAQHLFYEKMAQEFSFNPRVNM